MEAVAEQPAAKRRQAKPIKAADSGAHARYVTIALASQLTGLTQKAINRKIDDGKWVEGSEWIKGRDGHRYIDMRGYERWVAGDRG